MALEIKLPALSESVSEGVVSEVRVKPGDVVKSDSIICVVEAEKSTVEVPADASGAIAEVLIKKGDKVAAGQVLCRVEAGAAAPAAKPAPEPAKPATPKPAPAPAAASTAAARNGEKVSEAKPEPSESRFIAAGPATRRLARKLGIALER